MGRCLELEKPNYYSILPANVRYDKELMANAKLLYGEITALCNEKGICWAGNEYFANLYNVSKETISRWISQLNKKGYINVKMFYKKNSKEIDKRIISVVQNYPIDENVNTYCQENQSKTLLTKTSIPYCQKRQTPIDENVKENITSINNTSINNNNEQKQILLDYFETIWKEYPNKKGKAKALEYYLQWIKGRKISECSKKLTKEQMYQAVKKYKKECEKNRTEQQYIKHGDTFFNKAILDYVNEEQEEIEYREYKELNMTDEEYQRKMNEGGKKYV